MATAVQFKQQQVPDFVRSDRSLGDSQSLELSCANCRFRETCLAGGMPEADLTHLEKLIYARRRVLRGERLFSAGEAFKSLFAVRSGFFKTSVHDREGREQVTGFFMGGDLLGMEGMGSGRCDDSATALEDSMVCVMPYQLIEEMARQLPALQRQLHSVLSREITRGHGIMLLLGSMSGAERLATFLIGLSRRLLRRGYSGSRFVLRMNRGEIGSYLGLTLETVSRQFSALQKQGLIDVRGKEILIVDSEGLERVLARAAS